MNRTLTLLALLLPLALACKGSDSDSDTRPGAGEQLAEEIVTAVPRAGVATELQLLRGALNLHQRMHGAFPEQLDQLETVTRLKYPDEYEYDAATGSVKSRRFPEL